MNSHIYLVDFINYCTKENISGPLVTVDEQIKKYENSLPKEILLAKQYLGKLQNIFKLQIEPIVEYFICAEKLRRKSSPASLEQPLINNASILLIMHRIMVFLENRNFYYIRPYNSEEFETAYFHLLSFVVREKDSLIELFPPADIRRGKKIKLDNLK